ncbi:MAG: family 43 glycosylhydrolase [Christensenellaceae bacterium]|nr:family 43 glycosylhydrolase [Christensenellaceae bacterium]MBR3841966.1 family 43 glycosylhydrolase [Christensenellaceae bacterium]
MENKYSVHVRDIMISDPCVLASPDTKKYYIYARMFDTQLFPEVKIGPTFYAMESPDLIHWSRPILVFEKPDDFWADLDYWAPECHYYKGKYYLISSFRAEKKFRACQCLVSDSPLGPFVPLANEPVTPKNWQCLDGTLYEDKKGKPWMVFCHEWLQVYDGQVAAVPLSDDLSKAIGEPHILFRASDAPWSGAINEDGHVTDGPWLHRMKNGTLIMLWSSFSYAGYTVGYAKSLSGDVLGPWEQMEKPLWALDGAHAMMFKTFEGRLMMSLHCPNVHQKKRMHLFEMQEDGDKLHVVNEITGNWYNCVSGKIGERFNYGVQTDEEAVFTDMTF